MGTKSESCFVGFELRLCRGSLFDEVLRVGFAIAAKCSVLRNWLETASLTQAVQLDKPRRRRARIPGIKLVPRLLVRCYVR